MNERINQLLGQAYDQAVPETWTELSSEQLGRVFDKFAELIVRECAKVAVEAESTGVARLIMIHFGVEDV